MKLWGGRFTKNTDDLTRDFNASISFDKRLYKEDIQGSMAHIKMLMKQGILTKDEYSLIHNNLDEIQKEISDGDFIFTNELEDIHMTIEKSLIERIGDIGKKVHTGRSRNDQVALDMKLYIKSEIKNILNLINQLSDVLIGISKDHTDTIMPGFTHLQKAQPITLAHHIMSYIAMLDRDSTRLIDCYHRADTMPLGSGALASTSYDFDRVFVAEELGFKGITMNSIDAVSDRDFCIELLNNISIIMMHLSRFSEEIILWASDEFNFITLDDSFSTGSSIMPQKKNPDIPELIRGKTGRVYGNLMGLLTLLKGLPLAYNKDMQEDKEGVFDSIDTVKNSLAIFIHMIATATFNKERMYESTRGGFTNATDVADYLVKKGIPFRDAHEIVGRLVLDCIEKGKYIEDLRLDELQTISNLFDIDIYQCISLNESINSKTIPGSPSVACVEDTILYYTKRFNKYKNEL